MPEVEPRRPEEILAERLNTLLDVVEAESGDRYTFPDIKKAVEDRGLHISRQRWHYMRAGTGPMTPDTDLLGALADFFGVPAEFLTDATAETPNRVSAQLDLLRAMREAEVKSFAARSLTSDLSPETLLEIRNIIDETLTKQRQDH
ncbi:hypothetical protein [Sinomonas albida]|uniref:hypothetical protein n=1 Tax=Sinomonas albida TaxID=369942 RepID=UPI0010A86DCF|nr:hypothetical protein [Sinomonas albida]HKU10933.1 hypothetical protein [Sinomonas sp.]